MSTIPKRRSLIALLLLALFTLLTLHLTLLSHGPAVLQVAPAYEPSSPLVGHTDLAADTTSEDQTGTKQEEDEEEYWPISPSVNGPPTRSFRDNLRNDTKYITSWPSAGWSACSSFHLAVPP